MKNETENMKTVTVVLTKYRDAAGRFISWICGHGYSHASISIDEKEETNYSFNLRGFVIEKPKKHTPRLQKPGTLRIRMQVPLTVFEKIEAEIASFADHKERYGYSRLGVVLCVLHIPHKFHNQYFCSQFVAEILKRAGAIELKKKESLYLPSQLIDGMQCLFSKKELIYTL